MKHAWSLIAVVGLGACAGAGLAGDETLDESAMVLERKIALEKAPAPVQEAILKAAKEHKATLIEVMEKTTRDGRTFYEAEMLLENGSEKDFLFDAQGKPAEVANEKRGLDTETDAADPWHRVIDFNGRTFTPTGRNRYMILEPGYQLTLEGKKGGDPVKLVITVLDETKRIGRIETRIVEEREWVNGELVEVARNFLALCTESRSVFYFGEDVDMYKGGKVENHHGAWIVGGQAMPGILMPSEPILGAKYYQEFAPDRAMDRAEVKGCQDQVITPAGDFDHCLTVEETTPLEPGVKEYKKHAPGIGLVYDNGLLLTKHGFVKK